MENVAGGHLSWKGAESLLSDLEELYPGRSREIGQRLQALVETSPKPLVSSSGSFSAADAVLITYADMLHDEGESPLVHLTSFVERRLTGVFSHVHLLPFFPSSSDEGFSVMNYQSVEPQFGTWGDVKEIGRSLGLVCDLVLNHASAEGTWFRDFLAGRPPYDQFFVTRPKDFDASAVFRPRTHPLLTRRFRDDGTEIFVWTTFSSDQVDLDFSQPEVFLAMVENVLFYMQKGTTIIRLDAVAFAWKKDGTSCIDLPEVHTLVRLLRALIDAVDPGVSLLTETNLPQAINDSYFGKGDEARLVYRFALPPLALHAFVSGRSDYLSRWAAALPAPQTERVYLNFLSSHDGIGVTPVRNLLPGTEFEHLVAAVKARGGLVSERSTANGPMAYELNTTFFDALVEPTTTPDERVRAFLACHAAMFALSGVPAVWFHSLVGSHNWPRGPEITGSKRSIHRQRLSASELSAALEDTSSERSRVYRGLLALLKSRGHRSALDPCAPQRVLSPDGSGESLAPSPSAKNQPVSGPFFTLLRGTGAKTVFTVVNVSGESARCRLPKDFQPTGLPFDPSQDGDPKDDSLVAGCLVVPPWGILWLDGTSQGDQQ